MEASHDVEVEEALKTGRLRKELLPTPRYTPQYALLSRSLSFVKLQQIVPSTGDTGPRASSRLQPQNSPPHQHNPGYGDRATPAEYQRAVPQPQRSAIRRGVTGTRMKKTGAARRLVDWRVMRDRTLMARGMKDRKSG